MEFERFPTAGNGLRLMFIGQIVAIISAFIPVVGALGILAGGVLSLVGVVKAMPAHEGYRNAIVAMAANVVISFLGNFWTDGALGGLVNIAGILAAFLATYFVCTASGALLAEKGDAVQADRAGLIWKLYAVSTVVSVLCVLVSWIPLVNVLAAVAAVVMSIVELVTGVLYVVFLYSASKSLLA